MVTVCLTNDDGPYSTGLQELSRFLKQEFEVMVVVPDGQRSATGKGLTLNTPLRIVKRHKIDGIPFYTHTGTPADSVVVAKSLFKDIDLFVSGINSGANLGYQSMLTSGTVGAAFEAAFSGYPAVAISQVVRPDEWFSPTEIERDFSTICEIAMKVIRRVIDKGLPPGIDALNLNFPAEISRDTQIIVTHPTRVRIRNDIEKREDPNSSPYYWLVGKMVDPSIGTDAYEIFNNGNASLSPIVIQSVRDQDIKAVEEFMRD